MTSLSTHSQIPTRRPSAPRSHHLVWALAGLLGALVGCSNPPSTIEECTATDGTMDREECYFRIVQAMGADRHAVSAAVAEVPSVDSRDLLRLRLAVQDPITAGWLCKEAEGTQAQRRCKNVTRRPHLVKQPPPKN